MASIIERLFEAAVEALKEELDDSWIIPGAKADLGPCQVFGETRLCEVVRVTNTCDYGDGPFVTHVLVRFEDGTESVVSGPALKPLGTS
jgi:hypothetical protein